MRALFTIELNEYIKLVTGSHPSVIVMMSKRTSGRRTDESYTVRMKRVKDAVAE